MNEPDVPVDHDAQARAAGAALALRYRAIHEGAMRGLPICNPLIAVEAAGFRAHDGIAVGIVIAPWFMNLVAAAIPEGAPLPAAAPGEKRRLALPAGEIEVTVGELEGFGRVDACSLFSPMAGFDQESARAAAEAALKALFEPPEPEAAEQPALDRRAFLRGRFARPVAEARAGHA